MDADEQLLLQPDRPLRVDAQRHRELRVESGTVWITAGGAAGDLFLSEGEGYRVPRKGRVLVEAVRGMARVRLSAPRPHLPAMLAQWGRALLIGTIARWRIAVPSAPAFRFGFPPRRDKLSPTPRRRT
ncbi:MAG: DUF2917 domain-containing protein [Pseudomonadota bacterium]